jgi:putative transposase
VSCATARLPITLTVNMPSRPHSSLDGTTPDQAYFTPLPLRMAA